MKSESVNGFLGQSRSVRSILHIRTVGLDASSNSIRAVAGFQRVYPTGHLSANYRTFTGNHWARDAVLWQKLGADFDRLVEQVV